MRVRWGYCGKLGSCLHVLQPVADGASPADAGAGASGYAGSSPVIAAMIELPCVATGDC